MGDMREEFDALKEHGKEVHQRILSENQRFREEMKTLAGNERELTTNSYRYEFQGFRIDFYPGSGKWTVVGTNKFQEGPRKMVNEAKARLAETHEVTGKSVDFVIFDDPIIHPEPRDDDKLPWEE